MSFILIIVVFLCIGIITIKEFLTLGDLTRTIYEHPLVVSNVSLNAALNITKMHRSMKDVVLSNSLEEADVALKTVGEAEQKVYQQLEAILRNRFFVRSLRFDRNFILGISAICLR